MSTSIARRPESTEAAIFSRVWNAPGFVFTEDLAHHVLQLGFSGRDRARMHELAEKNQSEGLTEAESDELGNYIRVGDLVAIMQSKARIFLAKRG